MADHESDFYDWVHPPAKGAMRPTTSAMIRWLMRGREMSQRELARAVGLAESDLSTMLRGRRGVGLHHLEGIAEALGTTPGELLDAGRDLVLIENKGALMKWIDTECARLADRLKAHVLEVIDIELGIEQSVASDNENARGQSSEARKQ